MKKQILFLLLGVIISLSSMAQTRNNFKYQAVLRDNLGEVIIDEPVQIKISILSDTENGTIVYSEEHSLISNAMGLILLNIGDGTVLSGDFSTISWSATNYFLQLDLNRNSAGYITMGTAPLLSVPYALHAETVTNNDDADADPKNEIQDLQLEGGSLKITNNENATEINLAPYLGENTDEQTLVITEDSLAISNGNKVDLLPYKDNTDEQQLILSGTDLTIENGNTIDLSVLPDSVIDDDADPTNEIQNLSLTQDSIFISGGEGAPLPNGLSLWQSDGTNVYLPAGNVGMGTITPSGKLEVKGNAVDTPDDILFSVVNNNGDTVFAVYQGGVRVYVDNSTVKAAGARGGFAVAGLSSGGKGLINEYLRVTPDSVRIYVDTASTKAAGARGGFAVAGLSSGGKGLTNEFLRVTPDSVRVYIDNSTSKAAGSRGGFAVAGLSSGGKGITNDYFNISNSSIVGLVNPSEPRVLWYPAKEAFLVGKVLVESPDSVGTNSFVSGFESKAVGDYSQALGYSAIARGNYSTSIGNSSIAGVDSTTINAFAFGHNAYALDTNTVAIGRQAVASANNALAIGDSAIAGGINAIALGSSFVDFTFKVGEIPETLNTPGPIATGNNSLAIGSGVIASGNGSVVIGALDTASALFTTVFGFANKATAQFAAVGGGQLNAADGEWSVVSGGRNNKATESHSTVGGGEQNDATGSRATVAGGSDNIASGDMSSVLGGFGNEAIGYNSIASGYYTDATGDYSTTIGGKWTEAHDFMEVSMGHKSIPGTGSQTTWEPTDRLLTIGNGTESPWVNSNALVLLKNGNLGLGISDPGNYKLYVDGGNAFFSGDVSVASLTDRTPYPKDTETAYKAVLSMNRLPDDEYEEDNKENQLDHSNLHPFVKSSDGEHRDLSATVSAQNEVIKDLIKQIEALKIQVDKLSEDTAAKLKK